jgi:hypothetical protein
MSARGKASVRCVICGREGTERNHVAWFTMPFCLDHHTQFHAFLRTAGTNLEWTCDPRERLLRASQACMAALWILGKALENLIFGDNNHV